MVRGASMTTGKSSGQGRSHLGRRGSIARNVLPSSGHTFRAALPTLRRIRSYVMERAEVVAGAKQSTVDALRRDGDSSPHWPILKALASRGSDAGSAFPFWRQAKRDLDGFARGHRHLADLQTRGR